MTRSLAVALVLSAATLVMACGKPAGPLSIDLTPDTPAAHAVVRVSGLSSAELHALRAASYDAGAWQTLFRVAVAGSASDSPPMAGRYRVTDTGVEFVPQFPLDAGRRYDVTFESSRLASRPTAPILHRVVSPAPPAATARARVVRLLPSADVLPENLLRMYLEFSEPMANGSGREYLSLRDDRGVEIVDAFLALDVDLWSPDHRRYTVFFDPGRVKRGILPNDQFGRALASGRRYTVVVDSRWPDAAGQPLAEGFARRFTAGPVDMAPIALADWRVAPPGADTHAPLLVSFPKPLDHGLLQRAVGVALPGGRVVEGEIAIGADEREWRFTPREPWVRGNYNLVVLSILEDPAGNKIGRPFDIDRFDRIDASAAPERMTVPFVVK